MRLETTGAMDMPLEELPSGVFIVCKDGQKTIVIPVAEESLNHNRTSAAAVMRRVRELSPNICIDTGVEGYEETPELPTGVGTAPPSSADQDAHDSTTPVCSGEWRNIQHPSHRLMTRLRPTVCGGSVYTCPMEAYVISQIAAAVGPPQLVLVEGPLAAFELEQRQFVDLAPMLGAQQASGRFAVAYRTCPPDLSALQMAHSWLASSGGALVFVHGSVIRRPCPCGASGLSVSLYTMPTVSPQGSHQVDIDQLATDYALIETANTVRLCRKNEAYSRGSALLGGRGLGSMYLLGRASRRSLDACAIVDGVADVRDALRDAVALYDPSLASHTCVSDDISQ